jgi:hypothetical protein
VFEECGDVSMVINSPKKTLKVRFVREGDDAGVVRREGLEKNVNAN